MPLAFGTDLLWQADKTRINVSGQEFFYEFSYLLSDWSRRFEACRQLLGYSEFKYPADGFDLYLSRTPPHRLTRFDGFPLTHADFPFDRAPVRWVVPIIFGLAHYRSDGGFVTHEFPLAAAHVQRLTGLGPRGAGDEYVKGNFVVRYEVLPYGAFPDGDFARGVFFTDTLGNQRNTGQVSPRDVHYDAATDAYYILRYVSRSFRTMTNHVTISGSRFRWVDGHRDPVVYDTVKFQPALGVEYIRHQVPTGNSTVPASLRSAANLLGHVNSKTFDYFPPGTLLFTGVRYRPYKMSSGHFAADISYQMKYVEFRDSSGGRYGPPRAGHNWHLHFISGLDYVHREVNSRVDGSGRSVYDSADLGTLFLP